MSNTSSVSWGLVELTFMECYCNNCWKNATAFAAYRSEILKSWPNWKELHYPSQPLHEAWGRSKRTCWKWSWIPRVRPLGFHQECRWEQDGLVSLVASLSWSLSSRDFKPQAAWPLPAEYISKCRTYYVCDTATSFGHFIWVMSLVLWSDSLLLTMTHLIR